MEIANYAWLILAIIGWSLFAWVLSLLMVLRGKVDDANAMKGAALNQYRVMKDKYYDLKRRREVVMIGEEGMIEQLREVNDQYMGLVSNIKSQVASEKDGDGGPEVMCPWDGKACKFGCRDHRMKIKSTALGIDKEDLWICRRELAKSLQPGSSKTD